MSKAPFSLPVRSALAVAAVALATALRLLVERLLGIQLPFVMEVLAAVAAAYYGGAGPGLLATALGAAAVFAVSPAAAGQPATLLVYVCAGVTGALLSAAVHRREEQGERRFRQLVNDLEVIVWEADADPVRFTFVSRRAEEMLGYPVERWLTEPDFWPQLIHPEDREWAVEFCRRATAEGRDHVFEYRVMAADGRVVWLRDLVYVVRDEAGRARRMRGVMVNLTERKRAEEERDQLLAREQAARREAEEARRRLTFLAEASAVLAGSLDYETTLRSLARLAVSALADYCLIDVIEPDGQIRRVATAHHDPAREALVDELRRYPPDPQKTDGVPMVLRTGRPEVVVEVTEAVAARLSAVCHDAEHARLVRALGLRSCIIVPLLARGRTLGAITLVASTPGRHVPADLTLAEDLARRAALAIDNARLYREAQVASRLKDEFVATVSHELRTPLNAILGWAQLLRTGRLDPATVARAVETIERNARLQTQLVEDLLDVSRIITGKLRLETRSVALVPVIEAALDAVRPAAEAKGIELRASLETQAGPVAGDPDRLQQVVWNLLSNAIKFTPRGGCVEVRLAGADSYLELAVTDTGQGISAEFLPFVFDRFRQADASTTREHGGLGLGLAIVRHLTELHGGSVRAESAGEGQGASFILRLPLQKDAGERVKDEGELRVLHPSPFRPHPSLKGVRVLIVEDEADARDLLLTIFAQAGAEVSAVASATEALGALAESRPDVLVSDIGLPGEDGFALIRRVREGGERLPAVALTGYTRPTDRMRALWAGFQTHLSKPVDPAELLAVVAGLVRNNNLKCSI